ncbi:hypothetical protein GGI07_001533 [Coemansia sp. Benny D115]|nr:hypothetical protein GGI07_001533 [Coemansia sp. Benny D115]
MPSIAMDTAYHTRSNSMQVQDLLERSPVYTADCDLYPQRMREVMNQRQGDVTTGTQRRPAGNFAVRTHPTRVSGGAEDLEALLELYPGAARYLQVHQANSRTQ